MRSLLMAAALLAASCQSKSTTNSAGAESDAVDDEKHEPTVVVVSAVVVSAVNVLAVNVSPDAESMLPAVHDVSDGDTIVTHAGTATDVALSRDGAFIASVDDRGGVALCRTDDPTSAPVLLNLRTRLSTLRFSDDGSYLYVAGSPVFDIDGGNSAIYRIALEDGNVEPVNLPISSSVDFVRCNADGTLTVVTASNRIARYAIDDVKPRTSAKVFGGFLGCTSASSDGEYVAVSSQNEVNRRSAEPCKMTVFDSDCVPVFSYQFESQNEYWTAQHAFAPDRFLHLVTANRLRWFVLSPGRGGQRLLQESSLPIGNPTAMAAAGSPPQLWVADQMSVMEIDSGSARIIRTHRFEIGEPIGEYKSACINRVAVNLESNMLVVACRDGGVRIRSLAADKLEK
jgi:hypothetical protein